MGLNSGSVYVEGTEGQTKIGPVSLQWAIGRFVLFMYFFYPLFIQIIQLCMAFCCPPKLKDAPLMDSVIEKEYREYRVKQENAKILDALKADAHNRKLAMHKEIALVTISLKHQAFATEAERKRVIEQMKANVKYKHENALKKAIDEKYAKLKKLQMEKAKLIRSGKYSQTKKEELNKKQEKIVAITPVVLTTESTGLFTEESKPSTRLKTKVKDPIDKAPVPKEVPNRRRSIDSRVTGKTAATNKNKKEPVNKASQENKPKGSSSPKRGVDSKLNGADKSPKRQYVPGVRTKMMVPTFNKAAGKGPLRLPANYKFANERLS